MKELREVAGDADTRAQTEQIERAASEYLANFLDAVELYESLAVQHLGLLARNRGTLEELSPKLSARSEPRLATGYLGLYRAGLELIEDPGAAEFERAIGELDAYARSTRAVLPDNARTAFEARVKSYRDTATAILGATTRIAEHKSAYLKAAQTVEPLRDNLYLTRVKAAQQALELRNAQLAASHGEILALGETSSALQACLNVEEAAEVIKRFCVRSFTGDYGAVYLFQASRNYLDAITTWGDRQSLSNFPPNDCWALRRGQTHRMTDARKDPQCAH